MCVLDAKYNSVGGGDANNNGRSQIGGCVCDRRTVKEWVFCLRFGVMVVDVGLTMSDLLLLSSCSNALSNEEFLLPGSNRAMKYIVMFNPVVTIFTPIPKWLHPPHRFE